MNELNSVDSSSSSEVTASEDENTWISWYIGLRGNDYFCEVDEEFIQDDFNMSGLSTMVPCYENALDLILDVDIPLDSLTEDEQEVVESSAEVLYGLIHARFILTTRGMQKMYDKYQNVSFGRCPRFYCQGQPVLPVGLSDIPRCYSVNVYCPCCQDIFHPKSSKQAHLDGSYFGTTFSHLFLLTNPDIIIHRYQFTYVPRIYGFKISKSSQYFQRREGPMVSKRRSNTTYTNNTSTVKSVNVNINACNKNSSTYDKGTLEEMPDTEE